MVKRIGGSRRKTRHKFSKSAKTKGKISIRNYLQSFKTGERVLLTVEPAVHKGMYFPRFTGHMGIVKNKKGKCYEVTIMDKTKEKTLIVHPVHLRRNEK
jgi:large subunit ribosomal protein L21e